MCLSDLPEYMYVCELCEYQVVMKAIREHQELTIVSYYVSAANQTEFLCQE